MNFDEYQNFTRETIVYKKEDSLVYTTMGLASEAGEVAGSFKKMIRDDNSEMTQERRAKLFLELGDVLWYVARLSDELGFTLSEVAEGNKEKLTDRLNRNTLSGSGDTR